jgi:hypothetical protein
LPNDSARVCDGRTGERRVCIGALQDFQSSALLRSVVRSGEKGMVLERKLVENRGFDRAQIPEEIIRILRKHEVLDPTRNEKV